MRNTEGTTISDVKTALVDELPNCYLCKVEGRTEPAEYDARMNTGQWGYLCQAHYDICGTGLGLGKGQKLVVRGSAKQPAEVLNRADKLCRSCGKGCGNDSWNKETGRYRILDDPVKITAMISMGIYCEEI